MVMIMPDQTSTQPPSTEPVSGKIKFVQHFLPPLTAGKYQIELEHKVKLGNENTDSFTYQNSSIFLVKGDRFNLNPTHIKSVFPPNNSQGDFTGVLPHIVFTKKGLPWEWKISGDPQISQANGNVTPWIALLVFNEQDPISKEQPLTLDKLKSANLPPDTFSYPKLDLMFGEADTDHIVVIDIPVNLFNQIAPTIDDLTYLAHSRIVSSTNKTTNQENKSEEYSVLVANRLPSGKITVVHLVSLEGIGDYLPKYPNGQLTSQIPSEKKNIRLVSLKSWSFTAIEEPYSFSGLLESLDVGPLKFPCQKGAAVENDLEMGYVALNHTTRQGDRTVSWYRGPLVPYAIPEEIPTPIKCADAVTHYDPETGLFDLSYAAAWQVGRLLALNNREFSISLYQWRRTNQRQQFDSSPVPEIVKTFLGRLQLLYDVPFNYLVPHEKLLPIESIRFFQVDFNWIRCLVDGAFNIGRSTTADLTHDQGYNDAVHNSAHDAAGGVRSTILGETGSSNPGNVTEVGSSNNHPRIASGFLLRSKVVSAYPGLEVDGFGEIPPNSPALKLLRFERLFPDVLLCLFEGEVKQVKIHQPPEGLHFGVNLPQPPEGKFTKTPRGKDGKELSNTSKDVPFREEHDRVIQINVLAESLKNFLEADPYTSAEFALQMVEGVEQVTFENQSSL